MMLGGVWRDDIFGLLAGLSNVKESLYMCRGITDLLSNEQLGYWHTMT
jgi:hypothetical protein